MALSFSRYNRDSRYRVKLEAAVNPFKDSLIIEGVVRARDGKLKSIVLAAKLWANVWTWPARLSKNDPEF